MSSERSEPTQGEAAAAITKAESAGNSLDDLARSGAADYLKYKDPSTDNVINFKSSDDGYDRELLNASTRRFGKQWPSFSEAQIVDVIGRLELLRELFPELLASVTQPENSTSLLERAASMLRDLAGPAWLIERERRRQEETLLAAADGRRERQWFARLRQDVETAVQETEQRMLQNVDTIVKEQLSAAVQKEIRRRARRKSSK